MRTENFQEKIRILSNGKLERDMKHESPEVSKLLDLLAAGPDSIEQLDSLHGACFEFSETQFEFALPIVLQCIDKELDPKNKAHHRVDKSIFFTSFFSQFSIENEYADEFVGIKVISKMDDLKQSSLRAAILFLISKEAKVYNRATSFMDELDGILEMLPVQ